MSWEIKRIAVTAAVVAALSGRARENDAQDEAKAESMCGMDCGLYGICYAEANGRPDMCERKSKERQP